MNQKQAEKFASRTWKIYFIFLAVINFTVIYAWFMSFNSLSETDTGSRWLLILPGIFSVFATFCISVFNILSLLIYRLKRKPKGLWRFIYYIVLLSSAGFLVYLIYNQLLLQAAGL